MAKMDNLAHPYVNALFEIAKATDTMDQWLDDLSVLSTVGLDSEFISLVDNPRIEKDALLGILLGFLDKPHVEVKRFLTLLQEGGKLQVLPEIYQLFKQKVNDDRNIANAIIESAFAMSDEDKKQFEQLLTKKFGKTVNVMVEVKPELVGGIKVLINDMVIDASIKGGLENLAAQII